MRPYDTSLVIRTEIPVVFCPNQARFVHAVMVKYLAIKISVFMIKCGRCPECILYKLRKVSHGDAYYIIASHIVGFSFINHVSFVGIVH